ncbi:hypothetical protein ULG90_15570 [Halopseudomonas pachastrellae]|nr:hypothetical protein ULG90_15570 [Halopseudomonas pachastrellae]
MNYTALYSTLYRVRGLTRTAAKVFTWLFGVQLLVLYGLATVADAPLTSLAGPGLRFAAALAAFILAPRVFDAVLARISAATAGLDRSAPKGRSPTARPGKAHSTPLAAFSRAAPCHLPLFQRGPWRPFCGQRKGPFGPSDC